jgi:putative sterol carrier protein
VVGVVEAIGTFHMNLKERRHVLQLIEKVNNFTIKLVCEQKNIVIAFENGDVLLLDDHTDKSITCEIKGPLDSFNKLIEGKEKLRTLVKEGKLIVSAPFRAVLLLESIFYLTR